jgi:hypothetical protein
MLFLLSALVVLNVILLGCFAFAYFKCSRLVDNLKAQVLGFVTTDTAGTLSPLGKSIEAITQSFADRIGVVVQASIRGAIGGSMKGLNNQLEAEALRENPQLALANILPKSLKKNPAALMGLQLLMNKVAAGSGKNSGNTGGADKPAKFNL